MSEWVHIKKGDKRPHGRVLVAHRPEGAEWKLRAAIFGNGDEPPPVRIDIGIWDAERSKWCLSGPRLEYLSGVFAWTFLPAPPQEASDE